MCDVEKTKRSEKSLQPYRFLLNELAEEKLETINQLIISWADKIDDSLSFVKQKKGESMNVIRLLDGRRL